MYTLKKSLGQHFLVDEQVSQRIVSELKANSFERLLEVGPGGGALSKYLLDFDQIELKFVELDREKVEWLQKTYPAIKGKIIEGSILDIEMPFEKPFTVVGNFPYNISSQILFRMIEWKEKVPCMLGMFQKEVAERTAAKEGSKVYGVVSVLVQAFYKVDYLFEVHENSFNPPPKVKSAVIRLSILDNPPAIKSEKHLFMLVKAAFNQRRKTLRNATRALFEPVVLEDPLFDKRAEQLSVEQFAALTFRMR
jgi:16S rRNA (adenine1518-N6/adenine1519-N6)-dimethyltransferase